MVITYKSSFVIELNCALNGTIYCFILAWPYKARAMKLFFPCVIVKNFLGLSMKCL